jgi:hypothetical protein
MSLERPLQNSPLLQLIPDSPCKPTDMGKGDTRFSMEIMKQWAIKYAFQTKDVAKQLRGNTLKQTAINIHKFIYNNFQYQADEYVQNLYSPSCAKKIRATGIDCKSYSLIASTILLNLNIPHSFRRIKQPYFNETEWTHVYVVIPNGSDEIIIDGTINSMVEVPYVQKNDLVMLQLPHTALNGARRGTQRKPVRRGLRGVQSAIDQIVSELRIYAKVSEAQLQVIYDVYRMYRSQGIEPGISFTSSGVLTIGTYSIPIASGMNGFFSNIFPKGTILGDLMGSERPKTSVVLEQQQAAVDAQTQAAQTQAQAIAIANQLAADQIKKDEEEKAAKQKKTLYIVGGVAVGLGLLGLAVYALKD